MNKKLLNKIICQIDSKYQNIMMSKITNTNNIQRKLIYLHAFYDKVNYEHFISDIELGASLNGLLAHHVITEAEYRELIKGVYKED